MNIIKRMLLMLINNKCLLSQKEIKILNCCWCIYIYLYIITSTITTNITINCKFDLLIKIYK